MYRKGHELGSRRPDWRYPSAQWVANAERKLALAKRFPAILRGEDKPGDNAERLDFAQMAYDRKHFAAATRLRAEALESDPKLGNDRQAGHRYNAACAAALVAAGQARDELPPNDATKARLRRQALDWLKAELAAWTKLIETGPPQAGPGIGQTLDHWKQDTDLAGIRNEDALARLPADEQKAWRSLWADVDSLRKRTGSPLTAAVARVGAAAARGQSLFVGDPAPKLDVQSFLKGEPIATLKAGKCYVVEFWATWCAPCRVSIPHLTALQRKHPEVTFIGVSILENDQEAVKPFVNQMGEKMAYRVAIEAIPENGEAKDGAMASNWMKAAGRNGIPTAFVINKDGRISWIGHPMGMDAPLEKIVNGSWHLTAAPAESRKELDPAKLERVGKNLNVARQSKDPRTILAAIDEVVKELPYLEDGLGLTRFTILLDLGDSDRALEVGRHLSQEVFGKNAMGLNDLAWAIVDPDAKRKIEPRVNAFAVAVAEQADTLAQGKAATIADTLAQAYLRSGQVARAIETQERAVGLAKGAHRWRRK